MKKRVLATLLAVGLLFSGIAVQAAGNTECPHPSLSISKNTKVVYTYHHAHGVNPDCTVTVKQDTTTYTCTFCGEVVDVIIGEPYSVHQY